MHWIDLTIMAVYIIAMVVIGLLSRGERETTQDYFTAGGKLGQSWFTTIVVGISIAGTYFSGISFISYPSVTYQFGIILFVGACFVCMPITYLILRYWFLPRYLAGNWKFPYDVVEHRFGRGTRTMAAALFVMMRVGWMAAMIYAPTIAIMTMGNLGPEWFWPIVIITGVSNTIYTVFSGIRGVIVTEAIQMCVIALGIGATIWFALGHLPVGWDVAIADLKNAGKFNLNNWSLDPTKGITMWTVLIGVTIANLANYVGDQMALQRYLATGTVQAGSRSFFVNFIGVTIVLALLGVVGMSLFIYYLHANDPNLPAKADQVFPYFVRTQLPVGIAGLLLAALLAATSIPSGINTLAGVITLDFRMRFGSPMTEAQQLRFAKITSLFIGLAATAAAGLVGKLGTLFDLTQVILGVFAGPLLACVMMSVSRIRCSGPAMSIGLACGSALGISLVMWSKVAPLWISPMAAGTTALLALVLSLIFPTPDTPFALQDNTAVEPGFDIVSPEAAK